MTGRRGVHRRRGSGSGAPPARYPGSGARSWGSKGGRSIPPCQTAMFDIAWAGLSTLVSVQGAATAAGNAHAGGVLAPGGRVPSELLVKALVGSPEHHESGLNSNAVEGTDQQCLPLDNRLPVPCSGFPAAASGLGRRGSSTRRGKGVTRVIARVWPRP